MDRFHKISKDVVHQNEKCLACKFLPSCNGMCIQKKIENTIPKCPIEEVEHSLENQLKLIIN